MGLCDYGCGREANFILKNKKQCCSASPNSCPNKKNKYDQRGIKNNRYGKEPWNKGKNKKNNPIIELYSKKGAQTKKEKYARGEKVPWNKGLTSNFDERVRINSEHSKVSIRNSFANGERVAYWKGKNNPSSRRPITQSLCKLAFRDIFRHRITYYWLKELEIKECEICHSLKHLEVHHIESFATIFEKGMRECDLQFSDWLFWSQNNIDILYQNLLNYHLEHLEIAKIVCKQCHNDIDFHRRRFSN